MLAVIVTTYKLLWNRAVREWDFPVLKASEKRYFFYTIKICQIINNMVVRFFCICISNHKMLTKCEKLNWHHYNLFLYMPSQCFCIDLYFYGITIIAYIPICSVLLTSHYIIYIFHIALIIFILFIIIIVSISSNGIFCYCYVCI